MLETGVEGGEMLGRPNTPGGRPENGVYRAGRLEIRPAEHAALVDGRPLALTVRELALLAELARNSERILTREQLFEAVWGRERRAADRSVDVYVSRLRNKLAKALPGIDFIHTHFGIGYRFSPSPRRR
jgi:DNA-binding response OmpR family regulator